MKITIIRRGERIPTPSIEKDGTMGGFVRRQAPSDGITVEGPDGFISREALEEALAALERRKR